MLKVKKTLWKYQADTAAWYFVSISKTEVEQLLGHTVPKRRGWGQIPVQVTVGETTWHTSLFPSKTRGYDMPIKASVRKIERIDEGDTVECRMRSAHS